MPEKFKEIEDILNGVSAKTCAFISAENSLGSQDDEQDNLRRTNEFTQELRNKGLKYIPSLGVFEGNKETSFLIANIDSSDAKEFSEKYNQQAFIFVDGSRDSRNFRYFDRQYDGDYKEINLRHSFKITPEATNNYSEIYGVKFLIPFFQDESNESYIEKIYKTLKYFSI